MKKIYSTLMMLSLMVASLNFTACSSDDDDNPSSEFVGTWSRQSTTLGEIFEPGVESGFVEVEDTEFTYMQLKSDGTCVCVEEDEDAPEGYTIEYGTWSVSNNKMMVTYTIPVVCDIIEKTDDRMTLSLPGLGTSTWVRVSDSTIQEYLE